MPIDIWFVKMKSKNRKIHNLAFDSNNLQVLCESCNLGKSNVFEDDLRI